MKEIKSIQNNPENKQPSNLEAEQALLGSILVNNDIIDEVSSLVSSNIFYDPAHVKIYEVIEKLNNKGMIANPITLKNFFEKDNMLNEVGGTEYLVKLTRFSGSTKQAIDYAKIIHEMYLRRELVQISDKLSSDTLNANSQEQNAENIIEDTEKSLFDLLESWLERTPFLNFKGFDFWKQYTNAVHSMLKKEKLIIQNNPNYSQKEVEYHLNEHENAVLSFEAMIDEERHNNLIINRKKRLSHKATQAALLILLYRDEPILHSPFNLISRLIDIDELFTSWRQRHALMVRRMIGAKIGTGGSPGHKYLHEAADKHKIFSDLADLSTFFIPRSALPELPKDIKQNLGYQFKP